MFTGIIQGLATVTTLDKKPGLLTFSISLNGSLAERIKLGASVAVNGVCLTVIRYSEPLGSSLLAQASFDVMQETLHKTTLSTLAVGDVVNIERSAKFGDEIGGHLVSGHVHGTAKIVDITLSENNCLMTFEPPAELAKYIFAKGFVALDGASLTVVDLKPHDSSLKTHDFTVALIPETLKRTTFGTKKVGDLVNIELDQTTKTIVDTIESLM